MVDFSCVFKATYSGVPVYEMLCKGVAVMRRRSDSYLNATQILKVADFDKPQRTRILEREVQVGEHEKVQGGYGKYQGTWVPFERGKALAVLYEVDNVLAPILEFVKGDQSPPLAPKHVTAASARPKKSRETHTRLRKRVKHYDEDLSDIETQPTTSASAHQDSDIVEPIKRLRIKKERVQTPKISSKEIDIQAAKKEDHVLVESTEDHAMTRKPYAQRLLSYFMSGKSGIPSLLLHPPSDLDINIIIDDEGHTSLHWAAAMARIKIVKLIIENGADVYRVNYKGQTALMRSVLFTNNFESKTFDSLLSLLRTTIFNIDKKDQTVFHHIAATSAWRGKIHASRYYMEGLIAKLYPNQSELISILNVQDAYGDTALTIAARNGNKRLVRMLIDAGASTEIANEEGITSRDYCREIGKVSPVASESSCSPRSGTISTTGDEDDINEIDTREALRNRIEAMFQTVTSNSGSVPPISEVFDSFAKSYENDLIAREKILQKKKVELDLYVKRLEETRSVLEKIKVDADHQQVVSVTPQVEHFSNSLELKLKRQLHYCQKMTLQVLEEYYLKEFNEKPPSPPHQDIILHLTETANQLRSDLKDLQRARKEHVKKLLQLYCRDTPKNYQDYKRLISACCNVGYENVDLMLAPLLASFYEVNQDETEDVILSN
ncbi:hypothetical protein MFLAVUS_009086 [Mucor flavus]|uniref:HTH APSES-type domain-containing protein n=1 Tax=Mucor flavus TaxID=439312 RepID=A0ABP9Z918_9FUNG